MTFSCLEILIPNSSQQALDSRSSLCNQILDWSTTSRAAASMCNPSKHKQRKQHTQTSRLVVRVRVAVWEHLWILFPRGRSLNVDRLSPAMNRLRAPLETTLKQTRCYATAKRAGTAVDNKTASKFDRAKEVSSGLFNSPSHSDRKVLARLRRIIQVSLVPQC